jgi:hypothetical protein
MLIYKVMCSTYGRPLPVLSKSGGIWVARAARTVAFPAPSLSSNSYCRERARETRRRWRPQLCLPHQLWTWWLQLQWKTKPKRQ